MLSNAIVLGGGIAGLAAAAALGQRGVAVTLVEQAHEITEVGAGLQVSPNGLAVLRALGLENALDATGAVEAKAVKLVDFSDGRSVARLDLTRLTGQRYLFVHRADLVRVLLKAAREANVSLKLGCRVTRVLPGDVPEVQFKDGDSLRAEFVVAADGLHSVARAAVNGLTEARFTGQVAWRAIVPAEGPAPEATVTMGPGRHIVSYPLRGGRFMNLVAVQEREAWAAEGWNHADDPANLRDAFADFGGPAQSMLQVVREASLWGLFRHPVAETWVNGNIALIGDAAHPTLPFLAQGANLALEDAWAMADCLTGRGSLDAFTAMRKPRVSKVVDVATGNAWKYHLQPGPLRWAAHGALSLGSRLAPGRLMGRFDWIYRYDVTG